MGFKMRHSFSLGLYTMVFQAEIYAINTCVMENVVKGSQVGTTIFFSTARQPSRPLTASR